jgi:hypothetical protein
MQTDGGAVLLLVKPCPEIGASQGRRILHERRGTVMLASPGRLSDADYQQLVGLTVADKIDKMKAILTEVAATRTPQLIAALGPFRFVEGVGSFGEHLFIGAAAPTLQLYTVVIIKATGEVYKMQPSGLKGVVSQGPPKVYDYDLQSGMGVLMAR